MLIERVLYPMLRAETPPDGDGGGGAPETPAPSAPETPQTPDTPQAPAESPPESPGDAATQTQALHEAIWGEKGLGGEKSIEQEAKPTLGIPKPPEEVPPGKPEGKDKRDDFLKMPKGLTQQAEKRFQHLANEVRAERREREQHQSRAQAAEKKVTEFTALMREARATPDDFAQFIELTAAKRSGDFAKAKTILLHEVRELSLASGENILGSDEVFSDFPDLAEQVQGMQISEAGALEIARARRINAAQNTQQQTRAQAEAQVREWQGHKETAMAKVGEMVAAWRAQDIDFARKEPKISERIARLKQYHPSEWPAKVQEIYEDLTDAAATFGASAGGAGGPRPLRGGSAPSATARVPSNMFEAMFGHPKPT